MCLNCSCLCVENVSSNARVAPCSSLKILHEGWNLGLLLQKRALLRAKLERCTLTSEGVMALNLGTNES